MNYESSPSKFIKFSYHRNHQEFVLRIYNYLKKLNIPVWIDIEDGINIYQSGDDIIGNVCFMTPMYQASSSCQEEVQLGKSKGIPIIVCRLLPNWKPSGWLSEISNDLLTIDLRGINQTNFPVKVSKLNEKINLILENNESYKSDNYCDDQAKVTIDQSLTDRSIFSDDSNLFSLNDPSNTNCLKKKALKYSLIPKSVRLNLSNMIICNSEYILIHGNDHLHLFDLHLKLVRSNNNIKIMSNDLRDLSWCSSSNSFIILTKKDIYSMNPLTSKIRIIQNINFKNRQEEFVSCSSEDEKFFIITSKLNSFSVEEYSLPMFRFIKKSKLIDLIGTSLFVQNGLLNKCDIQNVSSIRYSQGTLSIIMEISSNWFIYVFNLSNDQLTILTKIPLEEKSVMSIINPINQWIIYKTSLSNSFIQISVDFTLKFELNEQNYIFNSCPAFIDGDVKLRCVASCGISHLVLLIDNALVLYKL